jgi:AraC family transcriptional regulator, transcriptional activator of pobA
MKPNDRLLVPFREIRHEQPDDCLHYEPVAVRGKQMNWTIPAHRHEGLHQFQMLTQGSMDGSVDGQVFEAQAPVMLMLAPGSVHAFNYSEGALGHQMTIPSGVLRQLLTGSQLAEEGLVTSVVLQGPAIAINASVCSALFESLAGEFQAQHPGRVHALQAQATLLAVHYLRARGLAPASGQRAGLPDTLTQRYRALLEDHFRVQPALEFYATRLGVTPDHLSRSCRRVTGQSALELAQSRLLLEARRLLAYTPLPVATVAAQLGYADVAYFSKAFRRGVGHAPTAYRSLVAQGVRD